jgi:hypothetical protein
MGRNRLTPGRTVTITIDGVTHEGTYFVLGLIVHVQSPVGTKATQLGMMPASTVAKLLLSELMRSHKA